MVKDNYKIIMFVPDDWGIDGRTLDPICRDPNDPNHVSEEVLRWHFRQSVLANMRGGGEPIFETDFPPGTDMMATMRAEPYSKERFEMEIASRLSKLENVSMRGGGMYSFFTTVIQLLTSILQVLMISWMKTKMMKMI